MKRIAAWLLRIAVYACVAGAVVAVALAAAAWWWVPRLDDYRGQVEYLLSQYLDQRIATRAVSGEWRGLNLMFTATDARVVAPDQSDSRMRFEEVRMIVDPLSLFDEERTFESLELIRPTIEAARLPDGRFRVGETIIGTPRGTLQRLLKGRHLEVSNGTLVWRDARAPEQGLRFEDVHLVTRTSGEGRRFELSASPPGELMHELRGSGRYDHQALRPGSWTADVELTVEHLNLSQTPKVIQEQLPWRSRGWIDTRLRLDWRDGRLTAAAADVVARDFVIPYAADKAPLSAERFSSTVSWERATRDWRMVFEEPEIRLAGAEPVSVSRFELQRSGEQRRYSAHDANLRDLLGVAKRLDVELPWKSLSDRLQPRGVFSQATLALTGPFLKATGWRFEGEFRNLGWRAHSGYPGIQGLSGRLTVNEGRGELSLSSARVEVDAANTLRRAVGFERVAGVVEWVRRDGRWEVKARDGVLANDDLSLAELELDLRLPGDGGSPYVRADARIQRARVDQLRRYLPAKRMAPKEVEWLDRALAAGEVTSGRMHLEGALADLPFDSAEALRVTARVRDGRLNFHPQWPDLKELEGVVELNGSKFEARVAAGSMMHSPIERVRVWSGDFFRRDRMLHIQGDMRAKADDVIQFLRRGPLNKNPPPAYRTMSATGSGVLSMRIELPFTRLKQDSRVKGSYSFDQAAVEVTNGVEITQLAGEVRFTDSTVSGEDIQGQMLGGPLTAAVSTVEPGRPMTFAITGSGEAEVSRLTPVVGPVLTSRLQGRASWSGRFTGAPGPDRLEVESDLQGAAIHLPAPVGKPADAARPLQLDVALDGDRKRIKLDLDGGLDGELHYDRVDGRPVLIRGALAVGGETPLPEQELSVGVRTARLDMDQWIETIRALKARADREREAGSNRDALFSHLRSLEVDVERLRYLHRPFGAVNIDAVSTDGKQWTARLAGERVKGTARLALGPKPTRYELDLARLHMPRSEAGEPAADEAPPDPEQFAHLAISAEAFRFGDMRLGRLDLEAGPESRGWRIRRLSLSQPPLIVEATGLWFARPFGPQRTRMEISAESSDLGDALDRLGLEEQVAGGESEIEAELSWEGEPGDFGLAGLDGQLSFNATDGRFLKLEPGSGRLLGLFNMDSISRRLKLDFTDVFEEGLAFDRITGAANINAGRLQTDGIYVIGPAALIETNGAADMAAKSYDFEVTVAPQLGGNLSLAGAIASPAAGVMLFVVQKLFKKQIAQLIHYKYRVTGPWGEPRVEQIEKPAQEADRGVGRP